MPKVPNHFSYRIEATLVDLNQTSSQSEWYDFEANLARIDYQSFSSEDKQLYGDESITEVHDFNQGKILIFKFFNHLYLILIY